MAKIHYNMSMVFVGDFIYLISSYIFLITISNLSNAEILGTYGLIISLVAILRILSNFDIDVGIKKNFGRYVAENKLQEIKHLSTSSIIFSVLCSIIILIITLNPIINLQMVFGIGDEFIFIIAAILIGNSIQSLIRSSLTSYLKSKPVMIATISGGIIRFPILALFYYFSTISESSIIISYTSYFIFISSFLIISFFILFKKIPGKWITNFSLDVKLLLKDSLPRWIPGIIDTMGSRLSVLLVFSTTGGTETGYFYIPFAIMTAIFLLSNSITQISFPVLSGLSNTIQQKEFLEKSMKIAFLFTMPVTIIFFVYSDIVLGIFGSEYLASKEILSILLISIPFIIFNETIYYWMYAKGEFKNVLFLGLSSNIPRMVLYFYLIPQEGGFGASIAYLIGTIVQFGFTIILLKKNHLNLSYNKLFLINIIPFFIGVIIYFMNIDLIGIPILIIITFICYFKIKLILEDDIESILNIFLLNENRKNEIIVILKKIKLL